MVAFAGSVELFQQPGLQGKQMGDSYLESRAIVINGLAKGISCDNYN